ncbi:MAG: hypothetical protein IK015_03955 [Treponema sp.]|nr:hypothetical protein [Treponema sp.]
MQKIQVAYKDIVLPEGGPNEEYLASLRNQLKDLEAQGQDVMLVPDVPAQNCKDVDAALEVTAAYKHCARRVKDCACVKGFEIPAVFAGMERGGELADNFKSELLEKHPHYVFE